jgi:hypothetical protein
VTRVHHELERGWHSAGAGRPRVPPLPFVDTHQGEPFAACRRVSGRDAVRVTNRVADVPAMVLIGAIAGSEVPARGAVDTCG